MSSSAPLDETFVPEGRIQISESAILEVIHEAVMSCYGVVDFGNHNGGSRFRRRLYRNEPHRGIDVQIDDDTLDISLTIVAEFGTPIFTVAQNVMRTVKFQVESVTGRHVERVDVHVDGLRVSETIEKGS